MAKVSWMMSLFEKNERPNIFHESNFYIQYPLINYSLPTPWQRWISINKHQHTPRVILVFLRCTRLSKDSGREGREKKSLIVKKGIVNETLFLPLVWWVHLATQVAASPTMSPYFIVDSPTTMAPYCNISINSAVTHNGPSRMAEM